MIWLFPLFQRSAEIRSALSAFRRNVGRLRGSLNQSAVQQRLYPLSDMSILYEIGDGPII